MFGMVVSSGIAMLSEVEWNRLNMVIFAVSLSLGFGLYLEPGALQHLPETLKTLLTSGLLPAAFTAIFLNFILPDKEGHKKNNSGTKSHTNKSEASVSNANEKQ